MIPPLPDAIILLKSLINELLILVSNCNQLLKHFLQPLRKLLMMMF